VAARDILRIAIEEAQTFAFHAGDNAQRLRVARVALNSVDRQLLRDVDLLADAIRKGQASIEADLAQRAASKRPNLGGI